jgi:hypothetical protein
MTHVHHCMCVMLPQKSTTLSGALSEVVSSAQVVQELPLANCTMDSRFVYYIINNFDTIHTALQQSLDLRSQGYQKEFSEYSPLVRGRAGVNLKSPCQ